MHNLVLSPIDPEKLISSISDRVTSNILKVVRKDLHPTHPETIYITRDEFCAKFKVDKSTLWSWTKKGKVKSYGIGARVYYKLDEVEKALKPLNS